MLSLEQNFEKHFSNSKAMNVETQLTYWQKYE